MVIAFLFARQPPDVARIMVASVKRHLTVPIIQLTDMDTPLIEGCTAQRIPWSDELMLWRMQHLIQLNAPEVCALDTDVVVQADLRPVFHKPFDVALTKREGPILDPHGVDLAKLMPYNCGVMFARGTKFWQACADLIAAMPIEARLWWGDQYAVRLLAPKFNTLELKCDEYNYTPSTAYEDVSKRKVVHYKGNRKNWMVDKWRSRTTQA